MHVLLSALSIWDHCTLAPKITALFLKQKVFAIGLRTGPETLEFGFSQCNKKAPRG